MFTIATKWRQECVCIFTVPCDYINLSQVVVTKGDNGFRLIRKLYQKQLLSGKSEYLSTRSMCFLNKKQLWRGDKYHSKYTNELSQVLTNTTSSKSTQVVTFLTCIKEVPWSNFGRSNNMTEIFVEFLCASRRRPFFGVSRRRPFLSASSHRPFLSVSRHRPFLSVSRHRPFLSVSRCRSFLSVSRHRSFLCLRRKSFLSASRHRPFLSVSRHRSFLSVSKHRPFLWTVRLQVCFPFYRSRCDAAVCRLATVGKVKGEGVAPRFPFGFWFSYSRLVFLVSSHQLLGSVAGRPGAGGSISSYFLREGYADVRDMFWGKVLFRSLYFGYVLWRSPTPA